MSQNSFTFWLSCVANCTRVGDSKLLFSVQAISRKYDVLCTHEKIEAGSPKNLSGLYTAQKGWDGGWGGITVNVAAVLCRKDLSWHWEGYFSFFWMYENRKHSPHLAGAQFLVSISCYRFWLVESPDYSGILLTWQGGTVITVTGPRGETFVSDQNSYR